MKINIFTQTKYYYFILSLFILTFPVASSEDFAEDICIQRSNNLEGTTVFVGYVYDCRLLYLTKVPRFREPELVIELYLSHNPIKEIQQNDFSQLVRLQKLMLDDCSLERIDGSSFKNLHDLMQLNLHNNPKLKELPTELFFGLFNLEQLTLHNNGLTSFSQDLFKHQKRHIKLLSLGNNPLPCDCSIKWLWHVWKGSKKHFRHLTHGFKTHPSHRKRIGYYHRFPPLQCYYESENKFYDFRNVDIHRCDELMEDDDSSNMLYKHMPLETAFSKTESKTEWQMYQERKKRMDIFEREIYLIVGLPILAMLIQILVAFVLCKIKVEKKIEQEIKTQFNFKKDMLPKTLMDCAGQLTLVENITPLPDPATVQASTDYISIFTDPSRTQSASWYNMVQSRISTVFVQPQVDNTNGFEKISLTDIKVQRVKQTSSHSTLESTQEIENDTSLDNVNISSDSFVTEEHVSSSICSSQHSFGSENTASRKTSVTVTLSFIDDEIRKDFIAASADRQNNVVNETNTQAIHEVIPASSLEPEQLANSILGINENIMTQQKIDSPQQQAAKEIVSTNLASPVTKHLNRSSGQMSLLMNPPENFMKELIMQSTTEGMAAPSVEPEHLSNSILHIEPNQSKTMDFPKPKTPRALAIDSSSVKEDLNRSSGLMSLLMNQPQNSKKNSLQTANITEGMAAPSVTLEEHFSNSVPKTEPPKQKMNSPSSISKEVSTALTTNKKDLNRSSGQMSLLMGNPRNKITKEIGLQTESINEGMAAPSVEPEHLSSSVLQIEPFKPKIMDSPIPKPPRGVAAKDLNRSSGQMSLLMSPPENVAKENSLQRANITEGMAAPSVTPEHFSNTVPKTETPKPKMNSPSSISNEVSTVLTTGKKDLNRSSEQMSLLMNQTRNKSHHNSKDAALVDVRSKVLSWVQSLHQHRDDALSNLPERNPSQLYVEHISRNCLTIEQSDHAQDNSNGSNSSNSDQIHSSTSITTPPPETLSLSNRTSEVSVCNTADLETFSNESESPSETGLISLGDTSPKTDNVEDHIVKPMKAIAPPKPPRAFPEKLTPVKKDLNRSSGAMSLMISQPTEKIVNETNTQAVCEVIPASSLEPEQLANSILGINENIMIQEKIDSPQQKVVKEIVSTNLATPVIKHLNRSSGQMSLLMSPRENVAKENGLETANNNEGMTSPSVEPEHLSNSILQIEPAKPKIMDSPPPKPPRGVTTKHLNRSSGQMSLLMSPQENVAKEKGLETVNNNEGMTSPSVEPEHLSNSILQIEPAKPKIMDSPPPKPPRGVAAKDLNRSSGQMSLLMSQPENVAKENGLETANNSEGMTSPSVEPEHLSNSILQIEPAKPKIMDSPPPKPPKGVEAKNLNRSSGQMSLLMSPPENGRRTSGNVELVDVHSKVLSWVRSLHQHQDDAHSNLPERNPSQLYVEHISRNCLTIEQSYHAQDNSDGSNSSNADHEFHASTSITIPPPETLSLSNRTSEVSVCNVSDLETFSNESPSEPEVESANLVGHVTPDIGIMSAIGHEIEETENTTNENHVTTEIENDHVCQEIEHVVEVYNSSEEMDSLSKLNIKEENKGAGMINKIGSGQLRMLQCLPKQSSRKITSSFVTTVETIPEKEEICEDDTEVTGETPTLEEHKSSHVLEIQIDVISDSSVSSSHADDASVSSSHADDSSVSSSHANDSSVSSSHADDAVASIASAAKIEDRSSLDVLDIKTDDSNSPRYEYGTEIARSTANIEEAKSSNMLSVKIKSPSSGSSSSYDSQDSNTPELHRVFRKRMKRRSKRKISKHPAQSPLFKKLSDFFENDSTSLTKLVESPRLKVLKTKRKLDSTQGVSIQEIPKRISSSLDGPSKLARHEDSSHSNVSDAQSSATETPFDSQTISDESLGNASSTSVSSDETYRSTDQSSHSLVDVQETSASSGKSECRKTRSNRTLKVLALVSQAFQKFKARNGNRKVPNPSRKSKYLQAYEQAINYAEKNVDAFKNIKNNSTNLPGPSKKTPGRKINISSRIKFFERNTIEHTKESKKKNNKSPDGSRSGSLIITPITP